METQDRARRRPGLRGAYLLHLRISRPIQVRLGALGLVTFESGRHIYVGSAKKGVVARIRRHRRLASGWKGRVYWHIDYLLIRPEVSIEAVEVYPGAEECELSRRVGADLDASAPVPGFGASDCRRGCLAHLYRVAEGWKMMMD